MVPSPVVSPTEDADDLMRSSASMAQRGAYVKAIEVLERWQGTPPAPALERELVALRRRGFEALDALTGPTRWPPDFADPFPDVAGRLPEVEADAVTAALVGGAIVHHGALIVRGLIADADVAPMVEVVDRAFAAHDDYMAGAPASEWFAPLDDSEDARGRRAWVRSGGAVWAAESPLTMRRIMEALQARDIIEVARNYFGEAPALSVNKLTVRKVSPGGNAGWHQDGSFFGAGTRALNLWITLTPCGGDRVDTPALCVVPRRIDDFLECKAPFMPNAIHEDLVAERFGTELSVPRLEAGDGMFFDERFLHRTHRTDGMTHDRYTIETWFFAASRFPGEYQGLLA